MWGKSNAYEHLRAHVCTHMSWVVVVVVVAVAAAVVVVFLVVAVVVVCLSVFVRVCVCVFVRLIYTYAHTHARLLARITCVVHFGLTALCCDFLRVLSLRDRSTTAPCRQTVGHVHPLEQSFPQEASEYWFQNIPIGFTHRRNAGSAQSTTPYVRRRKYRETTLAALRVAAPSARPCWRLQ